MYIAGLVEVVQAADVVKSVIERLAEHLKFLRELKLVLLVGDALHTIAG